MPRIEFQLPREHIERMDALMGANRRGMFLRKAVERELDRLETIVRKEERAAIRKRPPEAAE